MRRIRLDGLEFVGDAGDATYTIEPDSLRGWLIDGVDMRRNRPERPEAHGSYSLPGYLTGRSISWGGLIETSTPEEQEQAMRRLSGLLADGGTSRMVVESTDSLWTDVGRGGEFDMKMLTYGRYASYRVEVWAPNPRIYGDVDDFAAGEMAINRGNFPATPMHLVTGTSGAYTINGPAGKKFSVSSGPGSGTDRIDMASGRVYRNGSLQLGVTLRADLWVIPPGLPGVTHTVTAGSLVTKVPTTFV